VIISFTRAKDMVARMQGLESRLPERDGKGGGPEVFVAASGTRRGDRQINHMRHISPLGVTR